VPTDSGMCCAFNKDAADQIFIQSKYTDILNEFNEYDKNHAFGQKDEFPGKFFFSFFMA
jgi:hypothetical protein